MAFAFEVWCVCLGFTLTLICCCGLVWCNGVGLVLIVAWFEVVCLLLWIAWVAYLFALQTVACFRFS